MATTTYIFSPQKKNRRTQRQLEYLLQHINHDFLSDQMVLISYLDLYATRAKENEGYVSIAQ